MNSFFGLLPEAYAPFDPIVDDESEEVINTITKIWKLNHEKKVKNK